MYGLRLSCLVYECEERCSGVTRAKKWKLCLGNLKNNVDYLQVIRKICFWAS